MTIINQETFNNIEKNIELIYCRGKIAFLKAAIKASEKAIDVGTNMTAFFKKYTKENNNANL
jgi:hypothetical protein